jgi:hypothetical protein
MKKGMASFNIGKDMQCYEYKQRQQATYYLARSVNQGLGAQYFKETTAVPA